MQTGMQMKKILILTLSLFVVACVPKSDMEHAQTENNQLRAQVAQLQQQVTDLQSKLQEANSQLTAAQSQLSRRPAMPVTVTFRKALMGPGYVAVLNTTIKQDFPVLVTVKSKALGTSQQHRLNLSQVAAQQIGHIEGDPIEAGDEIVVENNNYESLSVIFAP